MPLYYCQKKDFKIKNIEKNNQREKEAKLKKKIVDVSRKSTPGVT